MSRLPEFIKDEIVIGECPVCEREHELRYGRLPETFEIRKETISVEAKVYYCSNADDFFSTLDDDEEKIQDAYNKYRQFKQLLRPDEIKNIRKQYSLSQRDFSRLLHFGDITIQRYEAGALQDELHNEIMVNMRDCHYFKEKFMKRTSEFSQNTVVKVIKKLEEIEEKERKSTLSIAFSSNYHRPAEKKKINHRIFENLYSFKADSFKHCTEAFELTRGTTGGKLVTAA